MSKVKQIIANIIGRGRESMPYDETAQAEPYHMQPTEDDHNLGSVRQVEDNAEQLRTQAEEPAVDLSNEHRRIVVRLGVRNEYVLVGWKMSTYIKSKGYEYIRIVGGLGKDATHVGILLSDSPTRFFSPLCTNAQGKRKFLNSFIVDEVRLGCKLPDSGKFIYAFCQETDSMIELAPLPQPTNNIEEDAEEV